MIVKKTKANLSKYIIPNFKLSELACRCGECHIVILDDLAMELLRVTRRAYDLPITINRWYSCQDHNVAVGGKKHSTHPLGCGGDIAKPEDVHLSARLGRILKDVWPYVKTYPTHWHVDTRPVWWG